MLGGAHAPTDAARDIQLHTHTYTLTDVHAHMTVPHTDRRICIHSFNGRCMHSRRRTDMHTDNTRRVHTPTRPNAHARVLAPAHTQPHTDSSPTVIAVCRAYTCAPSRRHCMIAAQAYILAHLEEQPA